METTRNQSDQKIPEIVHPVSDPITGIRPAGPIVQDDRRHAGATQWGVVARWMALALLAILFIALLRWVF